MPARTPHATPLRPLTPIYTTPTAPLPVNNVRPVGFFESNPNLDAGLTSPKSRFNFTGVCSPTLFVPRLSLSEEEEEELGKVMRELRAEAHAHALELAEFMRPFDTSNKGSVTTSRFVRQLMTQFRRLTKPHADLLCKAYAGPEDTVRYAALGKDLEAGLAAMGWSLKKGAVPPPSPGGMSPFARAQADMAAEVSEGEVREGFRVLLRTLHERRVRIGDTLRDFGRVSPFPGRITKEQLIRGLSSVGGEAAAISPRIMAAIAGTYALKSDPAWVDYIACIQDLEATTYLRSLESMDPDFANATFSREVAASPNPRFIKPTLGAEESEEVQAILATLGKKCARNRVFNVRSFANQYDKLHDGFLTLDRFLRVLSTLHILPPTPREQQVLVKFYTTPKGLDFKSLLQDLNLS